MTLIEWDNHNVSNTHIVFHNAAIRMLNSIGLGSPAPFPPVLQSLRLLLPATRTMLLCRTGKMWRKAA